MCAADTVPTVRAELGKKAFCFLFYPRYVEQAPKGEENVKSELFGIWLIYYMSL